MGQLFSPSACLVLPFLWGPFLPLWPAIAREKAQGITHVREQAQVHTAEQFVDALFSNNFESAWRYLHPQLQKEFSPEELGKRQAMFLKRVGVYKARLGSEINGNVVSVKVAFSNVTDTLIVIMDSNGKITGVDFPALPDDRSAQPLPSRSRP